MLRKESHNLPRIPLKNQQAKAMTSQRELQRWALKERKGFLKASTEKTAICRNQSNQSSVLQSFKVEIKVSVLPVVNCLRKVKLLKMGQSVLKDQIQLISKQRTYPFQEIQ